MYFLIFGRLGSPRPKCQQGRFHSEISFLKSKQKESWRKRAQKLSDVSYTNPTTSGSTLMTSSNLNHFLKVSSEVELGVAINILNLEGGGGMGEHNSVHSSKAYFF